MNPSTCFVQFVAFVAADPREQPGFAGGRCAPKDQPDLPPDLFGDLDPARRHGFHPGVLHSLLQVTRARPLTRSIRHLAITTHL